MPNPQFERGQARPAQPVPAHLRLTGITGDFLELVQACITAHADGIRRDTAEGDEATGRLLSEGIPDALDQGIAELASFPR